MENEFNPFFVSGYRGAEYFCDRENETLKLKQHIANGKNTTVFAIRRIGKTGLIQHVFSSFINKPKVVCIYVDILGTKNILEFTNQLATAIYNRFPENNSIGKKIMSAIRLLRPLISFDTLSGSPELSFSLGNEKLYETTIAQLFGFLDAQNIKVVFAIDEFQQILAYPEQNTEAILRTHIQQLKNTQFIFCGSDQKLMHEIFNTAKRPFFASCTSMSLGFIEFEVYAQFIKGVFEKHKRKISEEAISYVLNFTKQHTFYTQYLCNFLFALTKKSIKLIDVQFSIKEIFLQNESIYYQYKNLLTEAQWKLLRAIAKEDRLTNPHSRGFIEKYKLGTSSMVTRGMEALLAKEMIYQNAGVEKAYYEVYDKFLMRWLQYK